MADLKTAYTDRAGRTHTVEHILAPPDGGRERAAEELVFVLTRPGPDALAQISAGKAGVSNGDHPVCAKICGTGKQHQL